MTCDSKHPSGGWVVHKRWVSRSDLLRGEAMTWCCRREGSSEQCGVEHHSEGDAWRHAGKLNVEEVKP